MREVSVKRRQDGKALSFSQSKLADGQMRRGNGQNCMTPNTAETFILFHFVAFGRMPEKAVKTQFFSRDLPMKTTFCRRRGSNPHDLAITGF
jgi:hypothetical protein